MKVQSISSYNYYNRYKDNSGEKESPKPSFQQTPTKIMRKVFYPTAALLAAMALSSCNKKIEEAEANFNFNQSIDVTNSFKFNFNQQFYFTWNCNGDTINPPLPPSPPVPGDTTHVKPHDYWDIINHGLIIPNASTDSIAPGQIFPTAGDTTNYNPNTNDTIGFTKGFTEELSYEEFKITRGEYDPSNSTNIITAYKGGKFIDNAHGQTYEFTSGIYPSVYNGQEVYVEMIHYEGKDSKTKARLIDKEKGVALPDVILHFPAKAGQKVQNIYLCTDDGNVLLHKQNTLELKENGKYYSNQYWKEPGQEEWEGQQNRKLKIEKIHWDDVEPVAGGDN